jgi:hypothetical protein
MTSTSNTIGAGNGEERFDLSSYPALTHSPAHPNWTPWFEIIPGQLYHRGGYYDENKSIEEHTREIREKLICKLVALQKESLEKETQYNEDTNKVNENKMTEQEFLDKWGSTGFMKDPFTRPKLNKRTEEYPGYTVDSEQALGHAPAGVECCPENF